MSEMVERLAKATVEFMIAQDPTTPPWDDADEDMRDAMRRMAKHRIEAMREPTEAMVEAGQSTMCPWHEEIRLIWPAMIDEALK